MEMQNDGDGIGRARARLVMGRIEAAVRTICSPHEPNGAKDSVVHLGLSTSGRQSVVCGICEWFRFWFWIARGVGAGSAR